MILRSQIRPADFAWDILLAAVHYIKAKPFEHDYGHPKRSQHLQKQQHPQHRPVSPQSAW